MVPAPGKERSGEHEEGATSGRRLAPLYRTTLVCLLLLSLLFGGRSVVWYWSQGPAATDLRIFLTPVQLIRDGRGSEIYRFAAEQAAQNRLYPDTKEAGYLSYNHLSYELLLYWPLAMLQYRTALMVWGAMNFGFVFLIAWLLKPSTRALREYSGVPNLLWMFAFYPLLHALGVGQDSVVTLLMVVFSLRLMERGREFLSGFTLGLVLFKIHLALGIAFLVFFVPRKWRGLAGCATSAALVTVVSIAMVGPSFVHDYLRVIREQERMTPWGFIARFMPNYRGFLEWTLSRPVDLGTSLIVIFVFSLATVGVTWVLLRVRYTTTPTVLYAAAVPTVLLVSYHLHLQDLTLALLPMLVLLDRSVRGELPRRPSWALMAATGGFYLSGALSVMTPYLILHAALLAIPLLLLWVAAFGNVLRERPQPASILISQEG